MLKLILWISDSEGVNWDGVVCLSAGEAGA